MQTESRKDIPQIPPAVLPGYILGSIILVCAVWASYHLDSDSTERYFTMLLVPAGGLLGWVLGIFLSPRGASQQQQFQTLGRAIGTFVSGFLLAKLGPIFDKALASDHAWTLKDGIRVLLFFISFCLGLLFVFVGRTATLSQPPKAI